MSIYEETMTIDLDTVFIVEESSVTSRGYRHRTTIPSKIYNHLNLKNKDRLRWILLENGELIVKKIAYKP